MPAARYSFVAGPVQFFVLDTNLVTRAELDWLDAELGRSKARWKIVYGHHPIRSDGVYGGDNPTLQERLMPILRGSLGERWRDVVAGRAGLPNGSASAEEWR